MVYIPDDVWNDLIRKMDRMGDERNPKKVAKEVIRGYVERLGEIEEERRRKGERAYEGEE